MLAIEKSKSQPFSRLLYALGIRHVGEKAAYVLANRFDSLDKLNQATEEQLRNIPEVGPIMAGAIVEFFHSPVARRLIEKLKKAKLNMIQPTLKRGTQPLAGQTFVFTGELQSFTRSEAQKFIQELGANFSSSVSKDTDFVVAGENPGSKYERAKRLNVKIIDEKELKRLIK